MAIRVASPLLSASPIARSAGSTGSAGSVSGLALGLACALLLATGAQAQPPVAEIAGIANQWKKLDANGDGFVSREEAKAAPRLAAAFDQADTDKDGKISREELRAFGQEKAGDIFDTLDKDKDGGLSKEELANRPRLLKAFDSLDADKNGKLSPEEFKAAAKALL